jgi:hypothetical protein
MLAKEAIRAKEEVCLFRLETIIKMELMKGRSRRLQSNNLKLTETAGEVYHTTHSQVS